MPFVPKLEPVTVVTSNALPDVIADALIWKAALVLTPFALYLIPYAVLPIVPSLATLYTVAWEVKSIVAESTSMTLLLGTIQIFPQLL